MLTGLEVWMTENQPLDMFSLKSQKQRCVSLSTAEAEYIALASAIQ